MGAEPSRRNDAMVGGSVHVTVETTACGTLVTVLPPDGTRDGFAVDESPQQHDAWASIFAQP